MKYTAMAYEAFGDPKVFTKMELELPEPNDSQVVVKVEAASVNFADVMARKGKYSATGPPYVTGLDFVGRVTLATSKNGKALVGKRVVGFGDTGSYATDVLASTDLVFEIPEDLPVTTAAACPLLIGTTYALLRRGQGLQPGGNIVIHAAAGGIGLTAVQMAKQLGAFSVIALVGSSSKAEAACAAGATAVVALDESPNYPEAIKALMPDGVELILNSVAGPTVQQDLEILKPDGQIVVFGMSSGVPGVVTTDQLHHSSRAVSGFSFGRLRRTNPKGARQIMEQALPYVTSGQIRFNNVTEYSLYDVAKAHQDLESRATIGKLILIP